jgi:hypothetical protein
MHFSQWPTVLLAYVSTIHFGERQNMRIELTDVRSTAWPKRRVAIVMAGTPRSFVYPLVTWSIKKNLIDALGADGAGVDVFIRASTQDNIHGKRSWGGNGAVINASTSAKGWLDDALRIIKPVATEFVTLAQEEAQVQNEFPAEPWPSLVSWFCALFSLAWHDIPFFRAISIRYFERMISEGIQCSLIAIWATKWSWITRNCITSGTIG